MSRSRARPGWARGPTGWPGGRRPRPARARRRADAARPAGRRRRRPRAAVTEEPLARCAASSASAHAPCSSMISARCTRQLPLNGTRSGWESPVGQRRRPLLRPLQIEDLLARLDHAAVDGAAAISDTSSAMTPTMTSSSRAIPSTVLPARSAPGPEYCGRASLDRGHRTDRRSRRLDRRSRARSANLPRPRAERPPARASAPAPRSRAGHRRAAGAPCASHPAPRANSPPFSSTKTSQPAHRAARST